MAPEVFMVVRIKVIKSYIVSQPKIEGIEANIAIRKDE